MTKRIVLFGSNGFVSSSIKKYLKKVKYNFIVLGSKRYDLTNLKNIKKINKILSNDDIILFTSSIAPSKTFQEFNKNITMSLNMIKAIGEKKINKFVYLSSDAVYKDTKSPINEKTEAVPTTLHGLMHVTRERIFSSFFYKKMLVVRPTLIYGENDPHNGYGPNSFIRLAKKNLNIKLFGKGEERRDHININTVVILILDLIKKDKFGVFNLCSGSVISFNNLAKKIIKIIGSKSKIIYTKRVGPMHHLGLRQFDIKKLKKIKFKHEISKIENVINKKFIDKY